MKRILIAGAASALIIGSVAFAQADQSGAYGNQDNAANAGAAGSMNDDPAATTGAGAADTTTETTTETTTGAGADYAATGERG